MYSLHRSKRSAAACLVLHLAAKDQKLVAEKADLSVEAADLHASVGVTDTINAAPPLPDDLILDELRRALDIAASKALERL